MSKLGPYIRAIRNRRNKFMKEYLVRYTLHSYVYETSVRTASSEAAMFWIMNAFPEAKEISVVQ